jgi:hypothetical protein
MQTATTTQFRAAVRNACASLGYICHGGWTDKSPKVTNERFVGLDVSGPAPLYFHESVAKTVAKETETLLNKQGLTANTRTGTERHFAVRGTCVLA